VRKDVHGGGGSGRRHGTRPLKSQIRYKVAEVTPVRRTPFAMAKREKKEKETLQVKTYYEEGQQALKTSSAGKKTAKVERGSSRETVRNGGGK